VDFVALMGGINTWLDPLPLEYTWGIAVRVRDLSQAVISYSFATVRDSQLVDSRLEAGVWRGSDAPPAPERAETLAGSLETTVLESDWLANDRAVTVYLPPGHDPAQTWPVIYMTDGQGTENYAAILDPLIVSGDLPPVMLVGVHAPDPQDAMGPRDDARAAEYLVGAGDSRFDAHMSFFMDEVMPWAEATYGASAAREDRAVFGFSNGASFAMVTGLRSPERVSAVIAFSIAWLPLERAAEGPPVRYYLISGTLEPDFLHNTRTWADTLEAGGFEIEMSTWVAGHDSAMWWGGFPGAVAWFLGASADTPIP
jgi:enterochelin esterase-like enzyme